MTCIVGRAGRGRGFARRLAVPCSRRPVVWVADDVLDVVLSTVQVDLIDREMTVDGMKRACQEKNRWRQHHPYKVLSWKEEPLSTGQRETRKHPLILELPSWLCFSVDRLSVKRRSLVAGLSHNRIC